MLTETILQALRNGRILLSDGAWGTLMYTKGLKEGECPELWNITHFSDIKDIATGYIQAGSDMVMTNSLGANRFALDFYHLSDRVSEINEAAARASREAAGGSAWVIASVGPTGKMLVMNEVTPEQLYDAYKEQIVALEKGGADAVCIETMSDIEEAVIAVKAAKENTNLEVATTFTFAKTARGEFRTMMGAKPKDAAVACIAAGADIVGTNCGNGIVMMVDIVEEIKQAVPESIILVQPNAGLPVNEGNRVTYDNTPEFMAGYVELLIEKGANIIGGCCGTTPEHISMMRKVLDTL